jgi:hypothetical protein
MFYELLKASEGLIFSCAYLERLQAFINLLGRALSGSLTCFSTWIDPPT